MSVRENLLRLSRRRSEERRRHLGELELLAERLRAEALRLQLRLQQDGAADDTVSSRGFVERHAKVERSIAEIEAQIGAARADFAAAEQELQRRERDWHSLNGSRSAPPAVRATRRARPARRKSKPVSG